MVKVQVPAVWRGVDFVTGLCPSTRTCHVREGSGWMSRATSLKVKLCHLKIFTCHHGWTCVGIWFQLLVLFWLGYNYMLPLVWGEIGSRWKLPFPQLLKLWSSESDVTFMCIEPLKWCHPVLRLVWASQYVRDWERTIFTFISFVALKRSEKYQKTTFSVGFWYFHLMLILWDKLWVLVSPSVPRLP